MADKQMEFDFHQENEQETKGKKQAKILRVASAGDLAERLGDILDDLPYNEDNTIELDNLSLPDIVIEIDDGNPEHSSTISSDMMQAFLEFQEGLYKIIKTNKGRSLTDEERKRLMLRVRVKDGCTEFITTLAGFVAEIVKVWKDMTPDQIAQSGTIIKALVGICVAGSVLKAGFKAAADIWKTKLDKRKTDDAHIHEMEMKRLDLEEKKADSEEKRMLIESLRQVAVGKYETRVKAIDDSKTMIDSVGEGERKVYRTLSDQDGAVKIDGMPALKETLRELAKKPKEPVELEESKVVDDTFAVSIVDFSTFNVTLEGTTTGTIFKDVHVSSELMSNENYKFLVSAAEREPVHLRIGYSEKNGKLKSVSIIERLTNAQPETNTPAQADK